MSDFKGGLWLHKRQGRDDILLDQISRRLQVKLQIAYSNVAATSNGTSRTTNKSATRSMGG